MMRQMLERLTIRRFQKHKKLVIEFEPITTFVGETDAGKSSILRALRWVCQNTPSGDAFIQHGSNSAIVVLTADGRKIRRSRGKANRYSLDGRKYAAFGAAPPEPVSRVLNVSDINFQDQHDPAYWLSDSAGQVSRNLNQIINLGVIDSSLSTIAANVRRTKTEVELTAARLKQVKQEREALGWVPEFESKLVRLEKWVKRNELQRSTIADIAAAVEKVSQAELVLARSSPLILGGQRAIQAGEKAAKLQKRIDGLETLLRQIEEAESECLSFTRNAAAAQKKLVGKDCPICGRPITAKSSRS